MKQLVTLLLAVSVLFTACTSSSANTTADGLSKEDKSSIEFRIQLHNMNAKKNFDLDSIDKATAFKVKFVSVAGTEQYEKTLKSTMASYSANYNETYDIQKDRFLTLDSYMKYCEAHHYDPVKWVEYLK